MTFWALAPLPTQVSKMLPLQSPPLGIPLHAPGLHTKLLSQSSPIAHAPHATPQPLSPHCLLSQLPLQSSGWHKKSMPQLNLSAQTPQLPPQPLSPHFLSVHLGAQNGAHFVWSAEQIRPELQNPQTDPQPSGPQTLLLLPSAVQLAMQPSGTLTKPMSNPASPPMASGSEFAATSASAVAASTVSFEAARSSAAFATAAASSVAVTSAATAAVEPQPLKKHRIMQAAVPTAAWHFANFWRYKTAPSAHNWARDLRRQQHRRNGLERQNRINRLRLPIWHTLLLLARCDVPTLCGPKSAGRRKRLDHWRSFFAGSGTTFALNSHGAVSSAFSARGGWPNRGL